MPITDKDEDMPKWGWIKRLTYEQVFEHPQRMGVPILIEWYFDAHRLQCPNCDSSNRSWLLVPSHDYLGGVFLGCSKCKRVYGPLDLQEHSYAHEDVGQISLQRLVEICERTHQPIPSEPLMKKVNTMAIGTSIEKIPKPPKVGAKTRGRPPK